jgi:hypothetical protein
MTLDEKITQAQRHVDSGRRVIEGDGRAPKSKFPMTFLETFERTQQIYLADLLKRK